MRWSWFLLLGLSGTGLYLVLPAGLARSIANGLLLAVALAFVVFGARKNRSVNGVSWTLWVVGLLAWGLGNVVRNPSHTMVMSWADVLWVGGHVALIVGLLLFRVGNARAFRVEDILEGAIVAIGVALATWIVVIQARVETSLDITSFVRHWQAIVYAGADGFLVSLMVILLLSRRARKAPFALAACAFLFFFAGTWISRVAVSVEVRDSAVVQACWLAGFVLAGSVALYPPSRAWKPRRGPKSHFVLDRTRLVGLGSAILMAPTVMAVQLGRGLPASEWGWVVLGSTMVIIALAAARIACFLLVLRRQAAALTHAAISDPVTGLANRTHLGELLDLSIQSAGEAGIVVMVVDIDRFAHVNETFGYAVGDRVLREIGDRLVSAAVEDAVVGRLGGDQFVVSVPSDSMELSPSRCAEHFQRAVNCTMFVTDINIALEATVGMALSADQPDVDAHGLLQHAHVALTSAKHEHTRLSVYAPSMDCDRHEQMRLLGELKTALSERQLTVFFQPCLDLGSGSVTGVEALIRWQHPREGLIAPSSFLPDAERTGMLPAITAYVLEDALACCSALRRKGSNIRVAINLSVRNLIDPTLVGQVAQALQRHDLPPAAVEFEVTETSAMTDPRRSVDSLVALRDLGVTIAIDDYGTGYSSLAYLRSLPVQTLKIDKSFVTAMVSQPINASIVRSTIDLARSLGMNVVSEGVEDGDTLNRLRALGCDGAQGFYIGRPVPAEELEESITRIERELPVAASQTRLPTTGTPTARQALAATSRTTSNSSSDAPEATGLARSPECAALAGPADHAWNAFSVSHCVTTK